jgi:hypothetical protein
MKPVATTMPCCYIIDEDKELVILVAEGVSTDDEMIAVTRKLAGEPKYCREFRFFCDFIRVTENRTSSKAMSLIPTVLKHSTKSRCVILFQWTALNYGMFRMFEAYCMLNGYCVPYCFHDREQALACLNEGVARGKVME